MPRIEKSVFISYRRTNALWALAIYQHLTQHGYDVFYDYEGIASGDFEQVILQNIKARTHFIVVLTPSALQRCGRPGDWLRREIEMALKTRRNIVPLMLEGFDFGSPSIGKYLTGKLATLKNYNGLNVPSEYFEEAMARLRERYLNVPLEAVLHSVSAATAKAVKKQQAAARAASAVAAKELTAQEWFEQGYKHDDAGRYDEAIHAYSEAIRLKPDYADAYNNRGLARYSRGDLAGALRDYNTAIRLAPDDADAYYNRALTREAKGNAAGAWADYQKYLDLGGGLRRGWRIGFFRTASLTPICFNTPSRSCRANS
jgi:tetratricopeptide (TPR) repeat protein